MTESEDKYYVYADEGISIEPQIEVNTVERRQPMALKLRPGQTTPDGRKVRGWGIGVITKDKVKRDIDMIYITDEEETNVEEVEIRFRNYPDELKEMASRKFRELFWRMWKDYGLIVIKNLEEYKAKLPEINRLQESYLKEIFPEDIFPRAHLTSEELEEL